VAINSSYLVPGTVICAIKSLLEQNTSIEWREANSSPENVTLQSEKEFIYAYNN